MGELAQAGDPEKEGALTTSAGVRVKISGIVQGVGFRPYIYTLAKKLGLTGWVRNNSRGVEIEAFGELDKLHQFIDLISIDKPPRSRIDSFTEETLPFQTYSSFTILESETISGEFLPVSPDLAVCEDCRNELLNPSDRRYRYPFINCTNCGPRFTIIKGIPYDRPNTTMATFKMCPDCQREYDDPADRRFHAQPIACPICGPHLEWFDSSGAKLEGDAALQQAREFIKHGKIVAVKGLGGYHLACDATNAEAVQLLRQRKKRSDKAFALMAPNLDTIRKYCEVNEDEKKFLGDATAPIVLLDRLKSSPLPIEIAPGQSTLGFMLPYTPLHILLCEPEIGYPDSLVMTSGNHSDEPIIFKDESLVTNLGGIADGFLTHNREIETRVDDSVIREFHNQPYQIRRSRGFAPDVLPLPGKLPSVLAIGAELKNTFCLTRDDKAFISHYIGDMENLETFNALTGGVEHYKRLFTVTPALLACDLHPDYLASKYAASLSSETNLPLVRVQHHHAHIASCMAEHCLDVGEQVIGLSFDGTGYGDDGKIWGSEILICGYAAYERVYHLPYVPQPTGDGATKHVARMALSILAANDLAWDEDLPPVKHLCADERSMLDSIIKHRINAPLTCSMGRLFDAVSSIIGVCQYASYEGQAAIELEMVADPSIHSTYGFNINQETIEIHNLLKDIIADLRHGLPQAQIAAKFHNTIAAISLETAMKVKDRTGLNRVALSGGVWQNIFLLDRTIELLHDKGFEVLIHRKLPPNDGCISYGQAVVAAVQMKGN